MTSRPYHAWPLLSATLLFSAACLAETPKVPATPPRTATGAPIVVPATPGGFTSRVTGAGIGLNNSTSSGGIGINTQPKTTEKTVRTTSYIALGDARQWKSNDGKSLLGKLIAFEDVTVEVKIAANQQPQPAAPPRMPDKPTVVKDGKARLLIDNKPFEVPLDRLCDDDQIFINGIKAAIDAKGGRMKN